MNVKDQQRDFGTYFGFPPCCIADFLTRDSAPRIPRKLSGTGYIPCPSCNEKPVEALVATIRQNRICSAPFPSGRYWCDPAGQALGRKYGLIN